MGRAPSRDSGFDPGHPPLKPLKPNNLCDLDRLHRVRRRPRTPLCCLRLRLLMTKVQCIVVILVIWQQYMIVYMNSENLHHEWWRLKKSFTRNFSSLYNRMIEKIHQIRWPSFFKNWGKDKLAIFRNVNLCVKYIKAGTHPSAWLNDYSLHSRRRGWMLH